MTDLAISVEGLRKRFGAIEALAGVDFSVPRGRLVGLLGPNGAGKTTAIRILTTVIRPDAGRASVLGIDVVAHPHAVRNVIGLAGQFAAVDPHLTGRENLRLIGRLTHLPRRAVSGRIDELLERFQLADAGDRPVRTYSGGMRRRLDLAAALVHRPPVLFLDEPTTGLDPQSRLDLWAIVDDLLAEGTTVLLTTQYLEEVDRLAHDIVVIDQGDVIAHGTPADLKSRLGATVIEMVFADEATAGRACTLLASSTVRPPEHEHHAVHLEVSDATRGLMGVLRTLDGAGIEAQQLAVREPSLDDVFLALTGRHVEDRHGQENAGAGAPVAAAPRKRGAA
jgi:daunorubicin resistance ABC transporter ATP-binding subunit